MSFTFDFTFNTYSNRGTDSDGDYLARGSFYGSFIGYGLDINFLKHFYFHHNLGLGTIIGTMSSQYSQGLKSRATDFYFGGIMRMGIGYTF